MKEVAGNYNGKGLKIAIVISRFNEFITNQLLQGCLDTLKRQGVASENIEVFWSPGGFEIPTVLAMVLEKKEYDAAISLGVLIRGDTPHFDYIASELSKGIASLSLAKKTPIIFGVITADTIEQAIERAGTKSGNKGRDAALAAIEMANLKKNL